MVVIQQRANRCHRDRGADQEHRSGCHEDYESSHRIPPCVVSGRVDATWYEPDYPSSMPIPACIHVDTGYSRGPSLCARPLDSRRRSRQSNLFGDFRAVETRENGSHSPVRSPRAKVGTATTTWCEFSARWTRRRALPPSDPQCPYRGKTVLLDVWCGELHC